MTLGAGAESRTDRAAGQKRGPVERVEETLLHGVVEDRKHVGSEAAARLSLEPCANFHIFHMREYWKHKVDYTIEKLIET